MESQLDVSLLVKRFSSLKIEDVGGLVKGKCTGGRGQRANVELPVFSPTDFFCARSVGSGTYGGRLFVMKKALVFISA